MRLYLTPADFADTAVGSLYASVPATRLVKALVRASSSADSYCKRRLGLNGQTTLTQATAPGALTLQVASCVGVDAGGYAYVRVDSDMLNVVAVTPDFTQPPLYPGTLTLAAPAPSGHAAGAVVQGVIQEQRTARGGSTNAVDQMGPITQEGQMAEAHAPSNTNSDLVRVIRLATKPIVQLISVSVVQRWNAQGYPIPTTNLYVDPALGTYRFPMGQYVPQGSNVITTYRGGYGTVPDDVAEAVSLLAADQLSLAGPAGMGYTQVRSADQSAMTVLRGDKSQSSLLRDRAYECLVSYVDYSL